MKNRIGERIDKKKWRTFEIWNIKLSVWNYIWRDNKKVLITKVVNTYHQYKQWKIW